MTYLVITYSKHLFPTLSQDVKTQKPWALGNYDGTFHDFFDIEWM